MEENFEEEEQEAEEKAEGGEEIHFGMKEEKADSNKTEAATEKNTPVPEYWETTAPPESLEVKPKKPKGGPAKKARGHTESHRIAR